MSKVEFIVVKPGFIDGVHRSAGDTLSLAERQAEHLLISGQIAAKPDPVPAPQGGEDPPAKTGKK